MFHGFAERFLPILPGNLLDSGFATLFLSVGLALVAFVAPASDENAVPGPSGTESVAPATSTEPAVSDPFDASEWTETDLGPQITVVNVLSGAFGKDEDGRFVAYGTLHGTPARLAVVDPVERKTRKVLDVPGQAKGFYAVVFASDNRLYLGSNPDGRLYRYTPGAEEVEDLGQVLPECRFVWDLVEGPPGKLYGGTYPEGRLFEYDLATAAFRDLGRAVEGEDYVRSLAWDPVGRKLYAGIGSHAALIEYDPATGEKENILPDEYKEQHFVYTLDVVAGKLFAKLDPQNFAIVLDLKTREIEHTLPRMQSVHVSRLSPDDRTVYYTHGARLMAYDLEAKTHRDTGSGLGGNANAFAFHIPDTAPSSYAPAMESPAPILYTIGKGGWWAEFNTRTESVRRERIDYPRSPVGVQSMQRGPDGRIWTSGYLSGGVGAYDPATGRSEEFTGVGQSEGIAAIGSKLYFGVYPRARIHVYDTAQPWDPQAGNPKHLFSLDDHGQDRPFGMVGAAEAGKLFIGTVPQYGLRGGALTVYDLETGKHTVHRDLIRHQSIVSLVHIDGMIVGGTTVSGGLGIEAVETEGKLFVWDIAKGELVHETVPVPGKIACMGLAVGPDGYVWGWAEGVLFAFDPKNRKVVYAEEKFPLDWSKSTHVWRTANMLAAADGHLYGTIAGKLFRVNPATRRLDVVREGGLLLIADDAQGALYCARGNDLLRFDPPAAPPTSPPRP